MKKVQKDEKATELYTNEQICKARNYFAAAHSNKIKLIDNLYASYRMQELRKIAKEFNITPAVKTTKGALIQQIADVVFVIVKQNDNNTITPEYVEVEEQTEEQQKEVEAQELSVIKPKIEILAPVHNPEQAAKVSIPDTDQSVILSAKEFCSMTANELKAKMAKQQTETKDKPKKPSKSEKTVKKSLITVEAINACETRQEIYDILITGKKKEILEFVHSLNIYPEYCKGLNTLQKLATYCAAKILIMREYEARKAEAKKTETQEVIHVEPVTFVGKNQQICIDFEATKRKVYKTIFQERLVG